MIQKKDLLAFDFYKKEKFTGSFCGMRYLIEKEEEGDAGQFAVYTWPGPYSFGATQKKKDKQVFPFAEESLDKIADYLNQMYAKGKDTLYSAVRENLYH